MVENVERLSRRQSITVSGRNMIEDYLDGKPLGVEKYKQMAKAMAQFDKWDDESKIEFLSQFLNVYDLLDANCTEIVAQFCNLKWHKIPVSMLQTFVDFLATLAVNHIIHVEMIFKAVTERFLPELSMEIASGASSADQKIVAKMVPALSCDVQERIYGVAHDCIRQIIACIPLSVFTLLKCCESNYPHYRHPTVKLLAYNRNLVLLSETYLTISKELWSLMIDKLIHLDTQISAKKQCEEEKNLYETEEIFSMDDSDSMDVLENSVDDRDSMDSKLDMSMAQIIAYISASHNSSNEFLGELKNDINFKWIDTLAKRNLNLFRTMLLGFDEHILYSFDIHSVSYLWFYLCSLSEDICNAMLSYLWDIVKAPPRSPNDWKKAHNAAASICGFLARADFVSFECASAWLKVMADWCCTYVDNAGFLKVNVGGIQHGTFYATVQALLFVLCYRYREFHGVEEIHLWGLGRIVHSKLEPLRFISQAVALCFANVSRFLQIVYCNHILCSEDTLRQRPVELYFPFSFCTMNICSSKILPLMRKFTPIEELEGPTRSKLYSRENIAVEFEDKFSDDYDFMAIDGGGSYKSDKIKNLMDSIARSPLTQFSLADGISPH